MDDAVHRSIACLSTLILAACSPALPAIKPVSLKDEQPKATPAALISPAVVSHAVKIVASGGEGLTKVDLELAMAKALRARGIKVVEDGHGWLVTASVGQFTINWAVIDRSGVPHALIKQPIPKPGEIRGHDAVAAANEAAKSVAKFIPSPKGDQL